MTAIGVSDDESRRLMIGASSGRASSAQPRRRAPPPSATRRRAIVSMIACYALGGVLGLVAGHAVREYLTAYRAEHVPPSMEDAAMMYVFNEGEDT